MSDSIQVMAPTGEMRIRPASEASYWRGRGAVVTQSSAAPAESTVQDIAGGNPLRGPFSSPPGTGTADISSLKEQVLKAMPWLAGAGGAIQGGEIGSAFGPWGIPVGAITGAAMYGGAGRGVAGAAKPVLGMPAESPSEALRGELESAAQLGIAEAVGQGAGAAIGPIAKWAVPRLAGSALRVAPKLAEKFPKVNIPGEFLKAGIPVGRGAAGAAESRVFSSADQLSQILKRASGAGTDFNLSDMAGPAWESAAKAKGRALTDAEKRGVLDQIWNVLHKGPNRQLAPEMVPLSRFDPGQFQEWKQKAQDLADNAYAANQKGERLNSSEQFYKDIARGFQSALETIPGVAVTNRRTQAAIALKEAMTAASNRRGARLVPAAATLGGATVGGNIPEHVAGAVAAGLLTKVLMGAPAESRLAFALNNPGTLDILRHYAARLPLAAGYGLSSMFPWQSGGAQSGLSPPDNSSILGLSPDSLGAR